MAKCKQCGGIKAGKDGRCNSCRLSKHNKDRRKYHWTPALLAELEACYSGARCQVTDRLTELQRKTKWPRWALINEAAARAIRFTVRQPWLPEEDAALLELAGTAPPGEIARRTGRTRKAVERRAERLGASRRPEGYTVAELMGVLGAEKKPTISMIRAGMFGQACGRGGRVSEAAVMQFLARHPHAYDLRKVDQVWFKSLMFGRGGALED
jgi:hypothetical protein